MLLAAILFVYYMLPQTTARLLLRVSHYPGDWKLTLACALVRACMAIPSVSFLPTELLPEGGKDGGHGKLHRDIGLVMGVGLVVGNIIGSGIFITPSNVLCFAGSFGLVLLVWITGAIISLFGALSYAELGTLITKGGAEYAFILEAFSFKRRSPWLELLGSTLAFLYTWTSIFLIRGASLGIITLTFGRYLSRPFFIGCEIPAGVDQLFALTALCEPWVCLCIGLFAYSGSGDSQKGAIHRVYNIADERS